MKNPIARLTSVASSVFGIVANLSLMAGAIICFRRPLINSFADAINRTDPEPEYGSQTIKVYEFLALLHNNPWVNGLGNKGREMFKDLVLHELTKKSHFIDERDEILSGAHESSSDLDESMCDLSDIFDDFNIGHHFLKPEEILNILMRTTYQICRNTRGPSFSAELPKMIFTEINKLFYTTTDDHLKRDARAFLNYGSELQYDQPLPDDGNWPRSD
jgi:hypothetical protein